MRLNAIALALLLTVPRLASGQADTVRGVVYDSLAKAPLAGALVVTNTEVSTTTDSLGRFVIVSPGRVTRLTAVHDLLDRLGLPELTAQRAAETRWTAQLGTPSMETLWARLCTGKRPADGRGGILFGSARASDGRTRFSGARIEVQWESIRAVRTAGDTTPVYESLVARSDSLGEWAACGVQEFGAAGVLATANEFRSAGVLLPGDERPIRRVDLVLGVPSARVTVSGTVNDEQGQPVEGASVIIDGVEGTTLTNSSGTFTFSAVPVGSRMLQLRKIGFLPSLQRIDVIDEGVRALTAVLERGVTLDNVKVTARAYLSRDRREFDERRRAGVSQVMDSTRVEQYPLLQSALRAFPSLVVQTGRTGAEFALLGRLTKPGVRCRVHIWVDGVREDEDYIRLLPLENIAAVELFNSDAFAPARFRTFGDTCNTLLVWTKGYLKG